MKKIMLFLSLFFGTLNIQSQITLATFEDESKDSLYVNLPNNCNLSLFLIAPSVGQNSHQSGINTSLKSYVAVNVPDAGWDGNFGELKLKSPVLITENNRYLWFKCYRSIQPKPFRVAVNDNYENDQNVVFFGLLAENDKWTECCADLGTFMGRELISLNFIFSCNWSEPRSGWGESTYMFDDFELRNYPQPTDPSSISNMQDEYIVLYPNPVKNILYISASEQSVPYQVSVFDITGKKLLEQRVKKSLNVSNLKKGYYILKINETTSFQFIKE